ncbi:MAG: heavy-metal-associated domain-containing protein [Bacillales bacterium]|jgi:copper chaperone CopZ|nr:heavy-metal-associated domain-containing protein [Bacillales bacterium]
MKKVLIVKGMSCKHCAMHVKEALSKLERVLKVDVDLKKGIAILKLKEEIANEVLLKSLDGTDYTVVGIK